jgi:aminopeptidase N
VFGLEYELDVYMIVAVGDFNMGAMENKGLNIFNAKYVLAAPETATDDEYEAIEAVIGHEYFHNWTGNRVTCRDWFQLTLKEGLTVFRDQQFTADQTSAAVKRIRDVVTLRTNQFSEDAGPMAHPIRPESYISMDNFYTATVYEKGAEVVRLYHTLFGADGFRRGMDLYFARHDGQAVTCDDFRAALADANGADLTRFERWYAEAGIPVVEARGEWDAAARSYSLSLRQEVPETPARTPREPLPIPVRMGLLGADGRDLPLRLAGESGDAPTTRVLLLEDREATFRFTGVDEQPVPSLLRGFSAPVRLVTPRSRAELAFLFAHDSDPTSRWDAGQTLAQELLLELAADAAVGKPLALDPEYAAAIGRVLDDPALDGSLRALMLGLPNLRVLGEALATIDYAPLFTAREFVIGELARAHRGRFEAIARERAGDRPYRLERAAIDRRRLRNTALRYLAALGDDGWTRATLDQFERADNMTDRQAALAILVDLPGAARDVPLARFYEEWRGDPLVLDKWFTVQAMSTRPDTFERVAALAQHPDFTLGNPNRVRALVASFAIGNPVRFHAADARPYASSPTSCSSSTRAIPSSPRGWPRRSARGGASRRRSRIRMRAALLRIAAAKPISKDLYEIATRSLGPRDGEG